MDIFAETDNSTKNIIQEILRESLKTNIVINEEYCTYYVKLLMLDPVWGKKNSRTLMQELITWTLNKFQDEDNLSLATITMQQYYMSKYIAKENVIKNHYDIINSTIEPLLELIINITNENLQHNKSKILRQMTLYIIMVSKMGDVKDHQVFKETFQALKSIVDDDDFNEYIKLNKKQRQEEIFYKQKVVMGIRLFNSDCGRQTAVIPDLPKIIQQSASIMQVELQKDLCHIMDIVNLTTTAIESVFVYNALSDIELNKFDVKKQNASVHLPDGISQDDLENTLNILVFARQHELYIRKFLLDLKDIQKNTSILLSYLKEVLSKLHHSVKYKIAVMASTVFPLFLDLGEIWINIQEETIAFSHLIQVFKHLESIANKVEFDKDKMYTMIGDNAVMTDAMRLEKTTGIRIGQLLTADCELLDPLDIEDFENLHLEFLGFCIWKFILTNGALIPGNPNMGVLKWDNKYYVFSVPEAAAYFAHDPKKMVMKALTIARKRPELITLLQIQEQIYQIRNIELDKSKSDLIEKKTMNKGIQTEIHPVPFNIDKKYEWNSWNILKYSQHLADISKRKTHATQTIYSHGRCNAHVQTVNQKDKNEQTKKDNYSNTEMILNYQLGLCARKDNLQYHVDFTYPLSEEPIYNCASINEKRRVQFGKRKKDKKYVNT